MTEHDQVFEKNAKPYEAPKLVRVSLKPVEAVLGHCKTPSTGGPVSMGSSCSTAGVGCRSFGS
jgi:hypothetical protein